MTPERTGSRMFFPRSKSLFDMVGGDTRSCSFHVIKLGGILVSLDSGATIGPHAPASVRKSSLDFTTQRLERLTFFDRGNLRARLRTVLPLDEARTAREMLAGAPQKSRKIVLDIASLGEYSCCS